MIVWLDNVDLNNPKLVGGKAFSLAHMIQNLKALSIDVPNGFVITSELFDQFIKQNNLEKLVPSIIDNIDVNNLASLKTGGEAVRRLIETATFTPEQISSINQNYQALSKLYHQPDVDVGVRSSAVGEDGSSHSWAGQLDTFLNIRGIDDLIMAIKKCFASIYTDRLIVYRRAVSDGSADSMLMAVVIQKMVRSDKGSAGVAFSLDTESGFRDVVVINGTFGLGETVVQGAIEPDEFIVHKPTLALGYDAIIDAKLGNKQFKTIYSENGGTEDVDNPMPVRNTFSLDEATVLKLAKWVVMIEQYYSEISQQDNAIDAQESINVLPVARQAVDVEWAVETSDSALGPINKLFIVQARSETVHSNADHNKILEYTIDSGNRPCLLQGIAVGNRIASGTVRVIDSMDSVEAQAFAKGDILVVDQTTPDWEPLMTKASAIVCNRGGRTCHAAIIARESGITAIVGTSNGTNVLFDGETVTVVCAEGDVGFVYAGKLEWTEKQIDLGSVPAIKTKLMLNVANPNEVFKFANYPVYGAGLVREEFIINNYLQVHPNALINYHTLTDNKLIEAIDKLIVGYDNPIDYFVNKLTYGLARIAAAFYPNEVIVRFSDFKSNEYANLLGGSYYEAFGEQNPMIGFRGASRYYDAKFKEAFGLECKAIAKLRNVLGLTNVVVMIPFCRTVRECELVLQVMSEFGLERGVNGLKVYIMCEIPANVILADEFCKLVDGFSIGSNDLTQLVLGLDRDSELITHIYDERNPAVKRMISQAIRVCKETGTKIGICGQGPSDYPDFAKFLVSEGIDSISVTPDAVFRTIESIAEIEKDM